MATPPTLYPAPGKCPVCSGELHLTELACSGCGSRIQGTFENSCLPLHMDKELFEFLKVFIFAEGSIKQCERILNCSYPKIKNLLKKTKKALGLSDTAAGVSADAIIDDLDRGKLSVSEALEKLKQL